MLSSLPNNAPRYRPNRAWSARAPSGCLRLISLLFLVLSSSTVRGERLPIRSYTVGDGLLQDRVLKIKQDSRGFLWFCTAGGISRFDGYGFANFTTADGLPDRHVNDFLET